MPGIGHWELIALAVILLLLFGSKQIPTIARQMGRGIREVKTTMGDFDPRDDVRNVLEPVDADAKPSRNAGRDDDAPA